ncbi:uncharacterized protein EI90DRAFT_3011846 [Cantharellus anzutake]|uniref:uncharacterized protein n=1 Tax=Cantharellus anzutake TaxID=1750568 RepID=UPI0019062E08|nr:uncharacterized protein EI90DRAFT_3011846 [Cantharellus anzutake]KAF8341196.1 hypothetical protein EI90DRAFT_3011846 [Cantharellus anzutake]
MSEILKTLGGNTGDDDEIELATSGLEIPMDGGTLIRSLLSCFWALIVCIQKSPGTKLYLRECCAKAIMHFIEHADHKDSVPKAKGCTPKYSAWVFSDNDWNMMEIIRDALKVAGHAQQSFSQTSKASSAPYLLSVYEGLITTWEGMRKNPKYSYIYDALDAGIAIMRKYYDETEVSPLAILEEISRCPTGLTP